jgi:tetratricopeptide (TPR) repeat protein
MTAPVASERDLAILRSFAGRIDPSDAGAHNNLGVLYFRKGLFHDAAQAFTRALALDPRMAVAQRNLEIVYARSGVYDQRIAALRERLRQRPGDLDVRGELARAYASVGQWDDAVAEFAAILAERPRDAGAMLQLGLAEQRRGRPASAAEWLARARELDGGSSVLAFHYGEVLYQQGMNDEALAALKSAVELGPDNADAHYLLAFVLGDMGRHAEARAASRKAVQLNPALGRAHPNLSLEDAASGREVPAANEPQAAGEAGQTAHLTLGRAFRQKGYYAEALREYRMALDRGEDRRLVHQAMAEVQLARRDLVAALELYEQLVVEHPDAAKLWNERGVCLHQSGRTPEALASYRRAIEAEPGYALAHNNLGVVRAAQGATEDAVDSFRDALRHQAEFGTARLNLALLLTQLGRHQLALEAYRQVLEADPQSAAAWNGIGLVLGEFKRYTDAKNAFGRAVEAQPDGAAAHYNLSFTLSQLGDFEGALREVRRALELDPYYVPQKFLLAIELQFEDPGLTVVPELGGDRPFEASGETFAFDPRLLDEIFTSLRPAAHRAAAEARAREDPFGLARDYLSKGLFEQSAAEVTRAVGRGADRAEGAVLLGDVFARRGAWGEALERYREAREGRADHPAARRGEARALLALGRAAEARILAEELLAGGRDDVDLALLAAEARGATGDPAAALDALQLAQARAPDRADVRKLTGDVALGVGDVEAAYAAYTAALELDPGFVQVWVEVGRLSEGRGDPRAAEAAYRSALEHLPTYAAASLALASLLRRSERGAESLDVLIAVLARDAFDFDALHLLAQVLLDDGRVADARAASERIVRFEPEHVAAHFQLGLAFARERRYREAVAQWERVVALEPGGTLAQQARTHTRTALDLMHIFAGEAA